MISGRSLLLVFGTVLFFLIGFARHFSDFHVFGPSWSIPAGRPWMAHHNLWLAIGLIYLLSSTFSVMRDFARRKRQR